MAFQQLTTTDELADLCARARTAGRVALDTEFLWERTYAPQLCLAQLNVEGTIAIADPLEGVDLEPIAQLISDPDVQVVMHAPHADLVALALRFGAQPTRVFDTQIAAGFIGLSAGLAYERVVAEVARAKLAPSESFTDWSRRPLSEKQLRYAAEDVEHLFVVADRIQDRLCQLGRESWAQEELDRRFADERRFVTQPEEAWRKVGRRGKLDSAQLAVLREVAAWRERFARTKDIPVSWVMKDPSIVELARRKPRSAKDLGRIRGIDGSMRESDRQDLLRAVERGTQGEPIFEPTESGPRAVRKRVSIAKGLATALLRARCEAADIAPELVGTASDVEQLIAWAASDEKTRDELGAPSMLRGWREQFGIDLVDLVEGRVQLQLLAREPYLVVHESAER